MAPAVKRRTIFLSFFLAVVVAIGVFHHTLICFGIKWALSSKLPKGDSLVVSYQKGKWEKGAFALHQVEISRQNEKKDPLYVVKIDDLHFVFELELFPFYFGSEIVVDSPEIELFSTDFRSNRKWKGLFTALDHLLFKKEMEVKQGHLIMHATHPAQAFFSYKTGTKGTIQLAKTLEGLEAAPLTIDFCKERGELAFELAFQDLDCAWMYSIARFFPWYTDSEFEFTSGNLKGKLDFEWAPSNRISQIQYDLVLSDASLNHKHYGLAFSALKLHAKEHLKRSNDPFFEKVWPYFIGNTDFYGAKIGVENLGSLELFGKLQFSSDDIPLADIQGRLLKDGQTFPLLLIAEGFIESEKNWRIAMDLGLETESGTQMTNHLTVASGGDNKYFFESKFNNMSKDPVELLQHVFQKNYPRLGEIVIDSGVFDGNLVGWIENGHLRRIEVSEMTAKELKLDDSKLKMQFSAMKVKGRGEFDFLSADFFDGSLWEIQVVDGELHGPDQLQLSQLKAEVSMHDQYVKPSTISGVFGDIEGNISLEGLYTHLNLNLDVALAPADLLPLWGKEKDTAASELLGKLAVDLDFQLKTSQNQVGVEGVLGFSRTEKEMDTVHFGMNWNRETIKEKGWIRGIDDGWFKGENLSSSTFNIPLKLGEKEWQIEGTVSLEGTLSSDLVKLSLDPSKVRYVSPYVILDAGDTSPSCSLRYMVNEMQWIGAITLKGAKLYERSFGLDFEALDTQIELVGENFKFKNVSAVSDGMQFKGEVSLEYQENDTAKLQITTNEIESSTDSAMVFLRHFEPFKTLDLPIEGRMKSGAEGMTLVALVGKQEELLEWNVTAELKEGSYIFTPTFKFENLETRLQWSWNDQTLRLLDSDGILSLNGAKKEKKYQLNVPLAEADFLHDKLVYDLRLETPTLDICRFVGEANVQDGEINIAIDSELTRFFGAKVDFEEFTLGSDGTINCLKLETDLSARDLYHHLDFIVHAGILPIKASTLEEMQSPRFEGATHLAISFNRLAEEFSFEAKGNHFVFGTIDLDTLRIHAKRSGKDFILDEFNAGSLSMSAEMVKEEAHWKIPSFTMDWKDSHLAVNTGFFHQESGLIHLPFHHLKVSLDEVLKLLPKGSGINTEYIVGDIDSSGVLEIDLSNGWKKWGLNAELDLVGNEFSKAHLKVECPHQINIFYAPSEGLEISQADFHFFHPRSNQLWAKCHFNALKFEAESGEWDGRGFKVIVPPEMLHHLGATHTLPYLDADAECLVLFDQPFRWDNQMEVVFDFHSDEELKIDGRMKEGYYWIRDKAWLLNDFCFSLQGESLKFKMNTLLDENPFDVEAKVSLKPHLQASVKIQETIQELQAVGNPLNIVTDWSADEGFYIQSVEGMLCGLDFSFHRDPRGSFSEQMVLTGQVKIDVPHLAHFLPKTFQDTIKEFEVGHGYEISGDCILSKENILSSHFSGYLKGKRFQLMGTEMETLLSEISIRADLIELNHFNLSDEAGIFSMNEIRIEKMPDQKWNLTVPHFTVQDFRPSLLKKIGRYRGRIKPLTVRDLSFHNIRGTLGNANSFSGEGSLYFTNTFKRDYNILDIPFEILGRLGLDMGLLVPVRGRLDYVISDGKLFLTELSSSYSEGKRSKFYLSPSQPSYIDFEGNINLNIKMRQYVLLKITEPFTLSIDGTFSDPRYSLK